MLFGKKIGIVLEPTVVRICTRGQRVHQAHPACTAQSKDSTNPMVPWGETAMELLEEAPQDWFAVWPCFPGSAQYPSSLAALLRGSMRSLGRRPPFYRPDVMVTVPAWLDEDARILILEVITQAGAKNAFIVERMIAIARDFQRSKPKGQGAIFMDCSPWGTECAVIHNGFIMSHREVQPLWNERIKPLLGRSSTDHVAALRSAWLSAAHLGSITTDECPAEGAKYVTSICQALTAMEEESPAQLWKELSEYGVVLSGELLLDAELQSAVTAATGMVVRAHEHPTGAVESGVGVALDDWESVKRAFQYVK